MRTVYSAGFALLIAILFASPRVVAAAQEQHQHEPQAEAAQESGTKMGDMMAQKKASTDRLNSLLAQVKGSTGDAKLNAMSEVIAILLEERAAMQEHSATGCPMMKK